MLRQTLGIVLLGMHLKVHNVSLVLGDLLVIANVNLFGNLRDETHVVRNDHDTSLKLLQATSQCINRFHIQWIGGCEEQG